MISAPPRWDVSNVFPGLESPEFEAAVQSVGEQTAGLEGLLQEKAAALGEDAPLAEQAALVGELIERFNAVAELTATVRAYIFAFVSTDSRNNLARRRMSEFQQVMLRLEITSIQFRSLLRRLAPRLEDIIAADPRAQAHAFFLRETAEQSRYMMTEAEEALAADLSLSGAAAWNKLQGTVTSQLSVDFELDGEVKKLPLPALINLHSHPDESVRRRAYEAELAAFKTVAEPLTACLNGVKGSTLTLELRRGREDALHSAIDNARIDRATLNAMLGAMEASFPTFRKYYRAKARRLGKEQLDWWDIFAPMGGIGKTYSYAEARQFILENFENFSPDLADFARTAFDQGWIDAEQRDGKRGGAFCMGVPGVKESRILSNFDGSLDQVSTIAHELGHGYHNHCAYRAGKTMLQQETPMTMAETASIMCETVVMQAVLEQTSDPAAQLAILETILVGHAQVIVDIYSRYLFEKEVFERRAQSELSADDLCDIMSRAQKAAYGDGVNEQHLHPYMWTWKPHYYYPGLSFYNFPYAFGLLFGTGLYAIYKERGEAFLPEYQQLLASTGEGMAADLADRFGINIRERKFWEDSLNVIAGQIERYAEL
jgi:pepF/M3 family oligoendopeptidase